MNRIKLKILYGTLICSLLFGSNLGESQSIVTINDLRFRHFQMKDGLTTHMAERIIEDRSGYVWVGTYNGLLRYDGYEFTKILDGKIGAILEDKDGFIWAGTQQDLIRYDPRTRKQKSYYFREQKEAKRWYDIVALAQDKTGAICVGTAYDCFVRLVPLSRDEYKAYTYPCDSQMALENLNAPGDTLAGSWLWNVVTADDGSTWIGTRLGVSELIIPDSALPHKVKFELTRPGFSPYDRSDELRIAHISKGLGGKLWIVCSHIRQDGKNNFGVIFQFDPVSKSFVEYTNEQDRQVEYRYIKEDSNGNIWNGPYSDGLQFIDRYDIDTLDDHHRHLSKFKKYPFRLPGDVSIANDNVQGFLEDRFGTIWVLSNFMGTYQIPKKLNIFRHQVIPKNSITDQNEVSGIYTSSNNEVWVSTWKNGVYNYNEDLELQRHYRATGPHVLSDVVSEIFQDSKNRIWALSDKQTISIYNKTEQKFTSFSLLDLSQYPFNNNSEGFLSNLSEDKNGNFWMGSNGGGLFYFNPESKKVIQQFLPESNKENWIESGIILSTMIDQHGFVWAGSAYQGIFKISKNQNSEFVFEKYLADIPLVGKMIIDRQNQFWVASHTNGLILFDPVKGEILKSFDLKNGLRDNIYDIEEDRFGVLWLNTPTGIISFNPSTYKVEHFGSDYGVELSQSISNGIYVTDQDELFFGGAGGFYMMDLKRDFQKNSAPPDIVLENLSINNIDQEIGKEGSQLDTALQFLNTLSLEYDKNNVSISYTGIQFDDPGQLKYAYLLENYHDEWQYVGTERTARMANINPGKYRFRVKAIHGPVEVERQLSIQILPPLWATWWARLLYFLSFSGIVGGYIYFRKKLRDEHFENEKISALNKMRSRFFANISHEFRTPLTLIQGPLSDRINEEEDPREKEKLKGMHVQTDRMLQLVNELLDLSKIDEDKLNINNTPGDINEILTRTAAYFQSYAENKKIEYIINVSKDSLVLNFDAENLEKILINLLSNAFKYTNENGKVLYSAQYDNVKTCLRVSINNDGQIIDKDELPYIFNQFYQASNSNMQGSGVGLALVYELVQLMNGNVSVTSEVTSGTTFIVTIPLIEIETSFEIDNRNFEQPLIIIPEGQGERHEAVDSRQPQILIVEDSLEVRDYVHSILSKSYQIIEAENGKKGWDQAIQYLPDLIISDVMMPYMDGVELCQKLKAEKLTDHIPVILLTAKADVESRIEGLDSGADDYLNKPFNSKELLARVKNLIEQRRKLKDRFKYSIQLNLTDIPITSADQRFIQEAMKVVEEHLDDADFSIQEFALKMNLSRTHLHKKLKTITDQSPSEFIRNLRLQRATELFQSQYDNVSQIAYTVGFSNLSYFTKCFKEKYGVTPSDYLAADNKIS